jgi:hypothetical protein
MAQSQSNPPYVMGQCKIPSGKQYRPYQGIPQVPFQGQQIQTQPFQHLQGYPGAGQQGHLYVGYQNPPYSGTQVPYYQNPPYPGMQVPVSSGYSFISRSSSSRF